MRLYGLFMVALFAFAANAQTVYINGAASVCGNDSTLLTATSGFMSYRWSTGAMSENIFGYGNTRYTVTVTDNMGNSTVAEKTIIQYALPTPSIEGTPYLCSNRPAQLSVIQTDYRDYRWSNGIRERTARVDAAGLVTVTVLDEHFCVGTATITVADGSVSAFNLPDSIKICQGDNVELDATSVGAIAYYWDNQDTTAIRTVGETGKYDVIVSNGQCLAYDTCNVLVQPKPVVRLGADTILCRNERIVLRAPVAEGYTYQWSDDTAAQRVRPNFTVTQAGIYGVLVRFGQCSDSDSVQVWTFEDKQGLQLDTVVCTPSYLIRPRWRGAATYQWFNGSRDSVLKVSRDSVYQVVASNGRCFAGLQYKIQFQTTPVIDLGADTIVCRERQTQLLLDAYWKGARYLWYDGIDNTPLSSDAAYTVTKTGNYFVRVSNRCGTATDDIKVQLNTCATVNVPSAFSPNGDGQNDRLNLTAVKAVKRIKSFRIFDRWGSQVFEATDFDPSDSSDRNTWGGGTSTVGVYVWTVEGVNTAGETFRNEGDVTLVR